MNTAALNIGNMGNIGNAGNVRNIGNSGNIQSTKHTQSSKYPTSYREVMLKGRLYRITSVYTGEKELGPTLEKLAVRRVLDEMDGRAKELLRA